jgi:putative PIN family toxin of toxin-antitoxin system
MDRIVLDTNVLVSAVVLPGSVPRRAVSKGLRQSSLLFSEPTMTELAQVLSRPKFDHYVSLEERMLFIAELGRRADFVPIISVVRQCRDPKDDKFLEVALNGRADVIITGDADLLMIHRWREITILSPAEYVKRET